MKIIFVGLFFSLLIACKPINQKATDNLVADSTQIVKDNSQSKSLITIKKFEDLAYK